jgi:uncharacterized membrane protein
MAESQKFHKALITQLLTLLIGSFSLIAALAWNEVAKAVVEQYIKPYLGGNSGPISLVLYALVVTTIAVLLGFQVSKIQEKVK